MISEAGLDISWAENEDYFFIQSITENIAEMRNPKRNGIKEESRIATDSEILFFMNKGKEV